NLNAGALTGAVVAFTNSAGTAVTITVGASYTAFNSTSKTATGNSLDQLNQALTDAGVNVTASFDAPAPTKLTFTPNNDGSGQTVTVGAPATTPTAADAIDISAAASSGTFGAVTAAVKDTVSQATRANLVVQYNQIMTQITTTAQDASFNGINLLNGDSL